MIYLSTTNATAVVVTLYESCTNVYDPRFIWKLTNQDTNLEYRFYQTDSSPAPWNYNSFTVSVVTSNYYPMWALSGIINTPPGQYVYEVWEATPTDGMGYRVPTIDIEIWGIKIVEKGILNVIGTPTSTPTYIGNSYSVPTYENI